MRREQSSHARHGLALYLGGDDDVHVFSRLPRISCDDDVCLALFIGEVFRRPARGLLLPYGVEGELFRPAERGGGVELPRAVRAVVPAEEAVAGADGILQRHALAVVGAVGVASLVRIVIAHEVVDDEVFHGRE